MVGMSDDGYDYRLIGNKWRLVLGSKRLVVGDVIFFEADSQNSMCCKWVCLFTLRAQSNITSNIFKISLHFHCWFERYMSRIFSLVSRIERWRGFFMPYLMLSLLGCTILDVIFTRMACGSFLSGWAFGFGVCCGGCVPPPRVVCVGASCPIVADFVWPLGHSGSAVQLRRCVCVVSNLIWFSLRQSNWS